MWWYRAFRVWGFQKIGVSFRGPDNKDCTIKGSMLGSPYLGRLPFTKNNAGDVSLPVWQSTN